MLLSPSPFGSRSAIGPRNLPPSSSRLRRGYNEAPRGAPDPYGNALVTSKQLIDTNPELVKRFTAALIKGLVYAVANPEESGRILHAAVPASNPDTAAAELRLLTNYVGRSASGAPIGVFEPAKVSRGIALMQSLGQFPTAYSVDQVVWFGAIDGKDR